MANGKYLRKPGKYLKDSEVPKENLIDQFKDLLPKFKANRQTTQRIRALAATAIVLSGFQPLRNNFSVQASAKEITPPSPVTELIYTIGVPNPNAEITVDGKNYKIDENSFIINSKEGTLAYDQHGNLLKGQINPEDFKEMKQITEEEMSHYDIRQVISDSDANVRSYGAINITNVISTVPSGNYVLASRATTSENDKEWLKTLSINDGVLYEGYMREDVIKEIDSFEETNDIIEEYMENIRFVETSKDDYIDLNLRSTPETGNTENIITTIPYGSSVQSLGETKESNNKTWISVRYVTPDGNSFDGWVVENYLSLDGVPERPIIEESKDFKTMFVETSKDDYINLNLRSSPETGSTKNIVTTIPYGSSVQLLGETKELNNKTWVSIRYVTPDGNSFDGWVVEDYLSQDMVPDKPIIEETKYIETKDNKDTEKQTIGEAFSSILEKIIFDNTTSTSNNSIITNATGNVTGIDVSGIGASELREILQSKIPNSVSTANGTYNTSQLEGNINYVYIKLGGSGYGKGALSVIQNYDAYEAQVAICEELGIPYGFYYYSTSITEEETQIELNTIKERLDSLNQKYDMNYNQLDMVVDFELHYESEKDRQYKGDIEKQTKAKAALINGIQEQGLNDNVLIYGPGRVMQHTQADQIIDLELLHSLLSNPENVNLWLCSHMYKDGSLRDSLESDIAYAEERGFSTAATQLVLDVKMNGSYIDINNMNLKHFNKLTQQQEQVNNGVSYSFDLSNDDDGR